jgi:hypothetical protein
MRGVVAATCRCWSGSVLLALCDKIKTQIDSICLVRECRELEECFGTHFTLSRKKQ